jgi:hypothetical protein
MMNDIGQGGPWAGIVGRRWDDSLVLEALSQFVGPATIRQVLTATGKKSQRIRRLPAVAVVWLIIAMSIYRQVDIPSVWRQVVGTLASLWLAGTSHRPPCPSAFSAARRRLGARPMRQLFCHTASPIATDQTRGAFYRGMRLMALDGVHFKIADTPANSAAFGRPTTKRYGKHVAGGYPQVHAVGLMELGTHVVCEAVLKPSKKHEYPLVRHLLKLAPQGSLVLLDKGFYGYGAIAHAQDRQVHVLGRVKGSATFTRIKTLADGSFLAKIYPTTQDKRRDTRGIVIRIIEYTFDDENRPGHGELHRLFTTLLNADQYPAPELIVLYHERWEFELGNDEIKTHQLSKDMPTHLRSKTPAGVVQEFYGLLIAYNAVRQLMHQAAQSVNIEPRELSFIHAIRVMRETIPIMRAARSEQLPFLYSCMIQHIATGRLPPRRDRINPRVIKVKMSNFAKKRPEHYNPPQPQKPFEQAVAILK